MEGLAAQRHSLLFLVLRSPDDLLQVHLSDAIIFASKLLHHYDYRCKLTGVAIAHLLITKVPSALQHAGHVEVHLQHKQSALFLSLTVCVRLLIAHCTQVLYSYLWNTLMDKELSLLRLVYPCILDCLDLLLPPSNAPIAPQCHQLMEHLCQTLLRRGTSEVRRVCCCINGKYHCSSAVRSTDRYIGL
jgi:hypothetical protein